MASEVIKDVSIRRREIRVAISWSDVQALLVQHAMTVANVEVAEGAPTPSIEAKVIQEQEGSPPYNADRWRAVVDISASLDTPAPVEPTGPVE